MDAIITTAGMRVISLLVGRAPQSMADLVAASGVTRTAVSEQLNELMASGFVVRTIERSRRGRPRHLYSATDAALSQLFANNQRVLAPALLDAVRQLCPPELAQAVLAEVTRTLADHYRQQLTASEPGARLAQLADVLRREGVLVDVQQSDGRWYLEQRTCPFVDMTEASRTVCQVEHDMMTEVLGVPVDMVGCRLDGCHGCTFEIQFDKADEPAAPAPASA